MPPTDAGGQEADAEDVADAARETGVRPDAGLCGNGDDEILRSEVTLQAGLRANFGFAADAQFDTAGITLGDGSRTWDLSGKFGQESTRFVETQPIAGAWFASDFSGATYSTRLGQATDVLGVFEVTPSALLIAGVVSPAAGLTQTKVTYATKVPLLKFPLKVGASWKTESNVSGTYLGVATFYTEAYESVVDARGQMKTPFGMFRVLRVATKLTKKVGLTTTVIRSHAFVAECFGTVATVRSKDGADTVDFRGVAELSRIIP
jgi:hypothetical protein